MKNPLRSPINFVSLVTLTSVVVMFSIAAYPQTCGSIISTDTVLTSDIGPCSSFGLAAFGAITLNLNGHTIRGTGASNSIGNNGILAESGVTITGPGTITGFTAGIRVDSGRAATPVVITGLRLTENNIGVILTEGSELTRIIDNTITKGGIGVAVTLSGAEIKGNTITRNSQQGISAFDTAGTALVVVNNVVTDNGNGLTADFADPEFSNDLVSVVGNNFSRNASGVNLAGGDITFEANLVEKNQGDGVVLTNHASIPAPGNLVMENVVRDNSGNGISVLNSDATDSNRIVQNDSKKNTGVDLFWDGIGTASCWNQNDFKTSSPATLPICP